MAKAFWEYGVLYSLLLTIATTLGSMALWSYGQDIPGLIVHLSPTPYAILVAVAVWRSAGNYRGDPKWAGMARIAILVVAALAIFL